MATTILDEARMLASHGIPCVGLNISLRDGHKALQFDRSWKDAEASRWNERVSEGHNGLAALTGSRSDLYVLDIDVKDDGMDAFRYLEGRFERVPESVPRVRTGNGGLHLYFSLSASRAAGLRDTKCRSRIRYEGDPMGIDTRGENGIVIAPPSCYEGLRYEWLRRIDEGRSNLGAAPGWLIDIINSDADGAAPMDAEADSEDADEDVDGRIADRIRAALVLLGDSESYLDRVKDVPEGKMYVFRVCGPRTCPYGSYHSGSNNFSVVLRGQTLLYCCNSSECEGLAPKEIGTVDFADSVAGSNNSKVDPYDRGVYSVLTFRYMEANMLNTDLGGAQVFATMYRRCGRIVYSSNRGYYVWDGKRYVLDPKGDRVRLVCAHQLQAAYRRFRHALENMMADEEDPVAQKALKDTIKQIPNWTKATNVKACMEFARATLHKDHFEELLGANPDILNVENGVLHLPTGRLLPHSTEYACDIVLDTAYRGLEHETPTVDAFFNDIFNGDTQVIEYVQALLGYSVTGHTSAELMIIFYGTGANGKGILSSMMSALLQDYYLAMQKSCIVKSDHQRGSSAGSASPHLAELKGRRIGLVDESAKDERLDAATVKLCTGGGSINARFLYGQNFTFKPTHQTFLMTNHRPEVDVTDDAIRRRLVLVPFVNQYKTREAFDPTNPNHRLRNDSLKHRLVQPRVLEEFLSWLARGAVRWYAQGLPETPALLQASLQEYYQDNDLLSQFIEEHCETSEDLKVSTTVFKTLLEQQQGIKINNRELAQEMGKRGFLKKVARWGQSTCNCFMGIGMRDI